jgi:hypothetical protein
MVDIVAAAWSTDYTTAFILVESDTGVESLYVFQDPYNLQNPAQNLKFYSWPAIGLDFASRAQNLIPLTAGTSSA